MDYKIWSISGVQCFKRWEINLDDTNPTAYIFDEAIGTICRGMRWQLGFEGLYERRLGRKRYGNMASCRGGGNDVRSGIGNE